MLEFLLGANILVILIFRWIDLDRPQPLTSMEWHFFNYDLIDLLTKLINEDNKEARRQLFEAKLDILKAIKDKANDPNKNNNIPK